eukprot:616469-Pleurochrysis_carterae.AAC.1
MRGGAGCAAFGGLRVAGPPTTGECRMGCFAGIRALHLSGPVADSFWAFRAVRFTSQFGGGAAVQLADA